MSSAMSPWTAHPVDILVVEDDPADLMILQRAVERHGMPTRLHGVDSGEAALEILHSGRVFDLILLDLRMPGMSGLDLLKVLKLHPDLATIPVIVLTGAIDAAHVNESYRLAAAAVLEKPSSLDGYEELVRTFSDFWIRTALVLRTGVREST